MARFDEEAKPMRADHIGDGLYYGEVYFVIGKPSETSKDNMVSSPPWAGAGNALIVDKGGKTVTIFAPYQLEAFPVHRHCYEYRGIKPARGEFDRAKVLESMYAGWDQACKFAYQKDFDTAAMVFRMLGAEVPVQTRPEGVEEKTRGGKEADVLGLLKPVKRDGRRGQVLSFFLGGTRAVREAMAEFGVTRSNLLSQLYLLQKDHGIGYTLVGDACTITLPPGCTDPFEPEKT